MNEKVSGFPDKPELRPQDPRFSSGPCKKHPGWSIDRLNTDHLGHSHRAKNPKQRLTLAIERSHQLLNLPSDWVLGIVPGSDTGAFEMAMWSMLGQRPVDAFVWESFSADWAKDLALLDLPELNISKSEYGYLPEFSSANSDNDIVFVFNGTTSGVRVKSLDWVENNRKGLVFCDATSAAYAMPLDFDKLDVVTWSWQKVLGSEGAHGMLALSPRAVERLESFVPARPIPKVFRLAENQKLISGIFKGATINTPSMLALEDLHSALDWAEDIGGLHALWLRTQRNFECIDFWVQKTEWIDWLAVDKESCSPTSMCLKIVDQNFSSLSEEDQLVAQKKILKLLEDENCAFDIGHYRSAPLGFRIWGGATIETSDLRALTVWLDWAFESICKELFDGEKS